MRSALTKLHMVEQTTAILGVMSWQTFVVERHRELSIPPSDARPLRAHRSRVYIHSGLRRNSAIPERARCRSQSLASLRPESRSSSTDDLLGETLGRERATIATYFCTVTPTAGVEILSCVDC